MFTCRLHMVHRGDFVCLQPLVATKSILFLDNLPFSVNNFINTQIFEADNTHVLARTASNICIPGQKSGIICICHCCAAAAGTELSLNTSHIGIT